MPAGLKQSSSVVSIGFGVSETAPNTFIQESVDLNLSPLDREVFVVLAINLDPFTPDAVAGTDTKVESSLTTTSQTGVQNLSNSNTLAASGNFIKAGGFVDGGVAFQSVGAETPIRIVTGCGHGGFVYAGLPDEFWGDENFRTRS